MNRYVTYKFDEDGYGVITLNRPEKRNAISLEMIEQFKNALIQAKEDKGKFLVLKSIGEKVFCAGGDLNDFHSNVEREKIFEQLSSMKDVLYEIATFPVPTICLLSGDAYGGGCELATSCDLRIAKENTKFGFVQSTLGILPGWGGGALLYKKVHPSFALHWLMEGKVFSAKYLYDKNWIHRLIKEDSWNEKEILKLYIEKNHEQMKNLKSQYLSNIDSSFLSEKMAEEVHNCSKLWSSKEHKQAINRILHKKNK